MATLTELQMEKIKEHVYQEEDALKIKYKAKNTKFDSLKVLHKEVEFYEDQGWAVATRMRTRTLITRPKEQGRQFEDDVWCMFFNLGFRTLNSDDKLRIQWGDNPGEDKQIDILAVGDEAIFVVECKAAEKSRSRNFQLELTEMSKYMLGMEESLHQIYGKEKRVKFIFATRNYTISEDDVERMQNNGIFHLNDNTFKYITSLINSYQSSVIYQFYGLMFKDELISPQPITIPALKGKMGTKDYFLFSIEPSTLLKIGFILHRTKVNDSEAPTYQRLLVPKRLKQITQFLDGEDGYFPNSILLNFAEPNDKIKIAFESIHKEKDSDSEFGLLHIPNAYGIAYIIDGQHRVYGYANSRHKNEHTIPVVAFVNMSSEEQLKIFMDINQNQKAVSKSLKIDLEQDLYFTEENLELRMKALRSSVIKMLGTNPTSILHDRITLGEDKSELSQDFFNNGLIRSGLIPSAKKTKWTGNTDSCLYDITETDVNKAMVSSRDNIFRFLNGCYAIADKYMTEDTKNVCLFTNRASFPFVALMGLLHTHLYVLGKITKTMSINDRIGEIEPYVKVLSDGLNNISQEDSDYIRSSQGQGAQKDWLLTYQNIINKSYPEYCPEELKSWQEKRDQSIQSAGEKLKEDIRDLVRVLVFERLSLIYGVTMEKSVGKLKSRCIANIYQAHGEEDNFDLENYDWKDWLEVSDYKDIISQNYSDDRFAEVFGIPLTDKQKSKSEKLDWIKLIEPQRGRKKVLYTQSDVNVFWMIYNHLVQYKQVEE